MEIFELRYFLAVAQVENVNLAAKSINVSPGSLSKAISRLEDELQAPLFYRVGRGIKLTPEGIILKNKSVNILQMEEEARIEIKGKEISNFNIYVSSEEILQATFGTQLIQKILKHFPKAQVRFQVRDEASAVAQVLEGEVHLALISGVPPSSIHSKVLCKTEFKTVAAVRHPLFKKFSAKQTIPVNEVLAYPFVTPQTPILGNIVKSVSLDGWRDDKFPRNIKYHVSGIKLMESLISSGMALGYLPGYFVEGTDWVSLKVADCPYSCNQTIRLISRDPASISWLNKIWDEI